MWFLVFCIYISSIKSTKPYYDKSDELDISHCNYGIYDKTSIGSICNCSRVIGNGPSCNINITFNNTHYYMTEICLLDDSILWRKNLEVLNEHVNITGKDKNIITGIINGKTHFKVLKFCERPYKNVYPVLRLTEETMDINDYLKSLENEIDLKKDIYYCNYGIYDKNSISSICNCSGVIGNGPSCNINVSFNNTHYYMTEICLLDDSILWRKNLEVLNEHVNITGKDKNIITGIINEKTNIKVMNFCDKAYKKVYPVLRPTKNTMKTDDYWKIVVQKMENMNKDIMRNQVILYLVLCIGIGICITYIMIKFKLLPRNQDIFDRLRNSLRNLYNGCKKESKTLPETDHDVDSRQDSQGSRLQVENGSAHSENEDSKDPLISLNKI